MKKVLSKDCDAMKNKYLLIGVNFLGILAFSLALILNAGYAIIIGALVLLLGSSVYTVIMLKGAKTKKNTFMLNTQSFSFLITWNLLALALLLVSILILEDFNSVLIFSIIFLSYSIGATIGEITRRYNAKKKKGSFANS